MIIKRFSATQVLSTRNEIGFISGRKYDTDLDRLGRGSTQRELSKEIKKSNLSSELKEEQQKTKRELKDAGNLRRELKKTEKELNDRKLRRWQRID